MENLNEIIREICSTVSISHTDSSGITMPVKYGKLDEIQPLHSKAVTRLYLEFIAPGGAPTYKILGVITSKLYPEQVTGMRLKESYTDKDGKYRQVWINESDFNNVRVIIPTPFEK